MDRTVAFFLTGVADPASDPGDADGHGVVELIPESFLTPSRPRTRGPLLELSIVRARLVTRAIFRCSAAPRKLQ